jgi:hypothetical protein
VWFVFDHLLNHHIYCYLCRTHNKCKILKTSRARQLPHLYVHNMIEPKMITQTTSISELFNHPCSLTKLYSVGWHVQSLSWYPLTCIGQLQKWKLDKLSLGIHQVQGSGIHDDMCTCLPISLKSYEILRE